jgi:hypothetical protein
MTGRYGSGRPRSRTTGDVESYPRLDMRWVRRHGLAALDKVIAASLRWTSGPSARFLAECSLSHSIDADGRGELHTHRSATVYEQRVQVVALPMRYGGVRLYYVCPELGHRCEALYLRGGMFASRQAHRLSYRSQSQTPMGRQGRRARKLRARALGLEGHPRPRGANRDRLEAAYVKADVTFWNQISQALRPAWSA